MPPSPEEKQRRVGGETGEMLEEGEEDRSVIAGSQR